MNSPFDVSDNVLRAEIETAKRTLEQITKKVDELQKSRIYWHKFAKEHFLEECRLKEQVNKLEWLVSEVYLEAYGYCGRTTRPNYCVFCGKVGGLHKSDCPLGTVLKKEQERREWEKQQQEEELFGIQPI